MRDHGATTGPTSSSALSLMEEAFDAGVSLKDMESLIGHHRNWNAWADNIRKWINEAREEAKAE